MTRAANKQQKTRLNLALTVALKKNIEQLQQELQLDSISETIRVSIRLLNDLSSRIKEGQKISAKYPNGEFKEILLPELEIPLAQLSEHEG